MSSILVKFEEIIITRVDVEVSMLCRREEKNSRSSMLAAVLTVHGSRIYIW